MSQKSELHGDLTKVSGGLAQSKKPDIFLPFYIRTESEDASSPQADSRVSGSCSVAISENPAAVVEASPLERKAAAALAESYRVPPAFTPTAPDWSANIQMSPEPEELPTVVFSSKPDIFLPMYDRAANSPLIRLPTPVLPSPEPTTDDGPKRQRSPPADGVLPAKKRPVSRAPGAAGLDWSANITSQSPEPATPAGDKPDVFLPMYYRTEGRATPAPEVSTVRRNRKPIIFLPEYGRGTAEEYGRGAAQPAQTSHVFERRSEKPDMFLPEYRSTSASSPAPRTTTAEVHTPPEHKSKRTRHLTPERIPANNEHVTTTSPARRVVTPTRNLDWSSNIISYSPEPPSVTGKGPKPLIILPNLLPYNSHEDLTVLEEDVLSLQEYNAAPIVQSAKHGIQTSSMAGKTEEILLLDMKQDDVLTTISAMTIKEKKKRDMSLMDSLKRRLSKRSSAPSAGFNRQFSNKQPSKKKRQWSSARFDDQDRIRREQKHLARDIEFALPRYSKRNSVADEYERIKREQRLLARDIEFEFEMPVRENTPVIPALARKFREQELDETEGDLLMNCDKHRYIRRSKTEPDPLGILNKTQRTEFGNFIRRCGTICLPTNYETYDTQLDDINNYIDFKRLCRLETQHTKEDVLLQKQLSEVHEVVSGTKGECVIPTPPPVEYTPMQYQYKELPQILVRVATAEQGLQCLSRKYTQVLSPAPASPTPDSLEKLEVDVRQARATTRSRRGSSSLSGYTGSTSRRSSVCSVGKQRNLSSCSGKSFCADIIGEILTVCVEHGERVPPALSAQQRLLKMPETFNHSSECIESNWRQKITSSISPAVTTPSDSLPCESEKISPIKPLSPLDARQTPLKKPHVVIGDYNPVHESVWHQGAASISSGPPSPASSVESAVRTVKIQRQRIITPPSATSQKRKCQLKTLIQRDDYIMSVASEKTEVVVSPPLEEQNLDTKEFLTPSNSPAQFYREVDLDMPMSASASSSPSHSKSTPLLMAVSPLDSQTPSPRLDSQPTYTVLSPVFEKVRSSLEKEAISKRSTTPRTITPLEMYKRSKLAAKTIIIESSPDSLVSDHGPEYIYTLQTVSHTLGLVKSWKEKVENHRKKASRRAKPIVLDDNSPYMEHHKESEIIQFVQQQMESSKDESDNFAKYKRRFRKMRVSRKRNELSDTDVRRKKIVSSVYLGGKTTVDPKIYLSPPPLSPISSDSVQSSSPDEDEDMDAEMDRGLIRILDQIRNISNASVMEIKTYKTPPIEVHNVIKCVYMILGEDLNRLQDWHECIVLLSKLGRKHIRRRVLRMRKNRVTDDVRQNAERLLAEWTSYDIAQRSRVCVLFFIWCKEICDLNKHPEDNPLLPVVLGRFQYNQKSRLGLGTGWASGRNSVDLPGEEPRMVRAAARAFKAGMKAKLPRIQPPVSTSA